MPVPIDDFIPRKPLGKRPSELPIEIVLLESHLYDRIYICAHVADANIDRYVLVLAIPHAAVRTTTTLHFVRTVHINIAGLRGGAALTGFSCYAILVGIR